MIKAQFLIAQHFSGFDMLKKKTEKRHIRKPPNVKMMLRRTKLIYESSLNDVNFLLTKCRLTIEDENGAFTSCH